MNRHGRTIIAVAVALIGAAACSSAEPAITDAAAITDAGAATDASAAIDATDTTDATEADAEPVDPWQPVAPLARGPRQETAVVALQDEVIVLGGFDGTPQIVATVEAYDPANDAWRSLADLPRALHHANAAVVDDRLFVLGALGAGFGVLDVAYEYDRVNDQWLDRTPLTAARGRGAAACVRLNGMIYVIGGSRGGSVADMDEYDPTTDSWRPLPPLPRTSDHLVAGAIDGKIYVAGGRSGGIGGHTDRLDIYDPTVGWSEGPAMPTSRGGSAAAVHGDRLFVFGGEGDSTSVNGVFDDVESFDVSTSSWTTHAPMRTPRHGTGAATVGDRIYVPGGADAQAFAAVDMVEVFTPPASP